MNRIKFLRSFIKNPLEVGSVTPSSKYLVRKMTKQINFNKTRCIVEFGAGTGCVTKELVKKSRNCKILSFEINKQFLKELKKIKNNNLIIINDRAENLKKYLDLYNFKKADYIVSSLPLAASKKLELSIIKKVNSNLKENGKYIQYQYAHNGLKSLNKFKNNFKSVKIDFVPLNIPPAFVYTCKK